jgi:hypothetical protein
VGEGQGAGTGAPVDEAAGSVTVEAADTHLGLHMAKPLMHHSF